MGENVAESRMMSDERQQSDSPTRARLRDDLIASVRAVLRGHRPECDGDAVFLVDAIIDRLIEAWKEDGLDAFLDTFLLAVRRGDI
jgi:hypothetical protein